MLVLVDTVDVGNVSNFMVVALPFVTVVFVTAATAAIVSFNCLLILLLSSFCGITVVVGRTTIFVRSLRRLGSAFICVLKNPVILVCDRIFGALLPLLILFIPEFMVDEDLNPFGILFRFVLFIASVSFSDV